MSFLTLRVRFTPFTAKSYGFRSSVYWGLAQKSGDFELAIADARRAAALAPNSGQVCAHLARLLSDAGRGDEALKVSERIVRLVPNAPSTWFARGRMRLASVGRRACVLRSTSGAGSSARGCTSRGSRA